MRLLYIRLNMDYFKTLNKKQIMTFIVVTIVIVLVIWVGMPYIKNLWYTEKKKQEKFDNSDVAPQTPIIDPLVGTIISGPGHLLGDTDIPWQPASASIPANYYFLDDGDDGKKSIQHNLCSKSCCAEQWPTPFKMKYDPYVCQNKDKFVPTNIMCSNT